MNTLDKPTGMYKLVRERDGLEFSANTIKWIQWNEDGTFKQSHDEPAIDRSLILGGNTWSTTTITKLIEVSENYIKFETQNSTYELFTIKK